MSNERFENGGDEFGVLLKFPDLKGDHDCSQLLEFPSKECNSKVTKMIEDVEFASFFSSLRTDPNFCIDKFFDSIFQNTENNKFEVGGKELETLIFNMGKIEMVIMIKDRIANGSGAIDVRVEIVNVMISLLNNNAFKKRFGHLVISRLKLIFDIDKKRMSREDFCINNYKLFFLEGMKYAGMKLCGADNKKELDFMMEDLFQEISFPENGTKN
jgi:hypothetical protein